MDDSNSGMLGLTVDFSPSLRLIQSRAEPWHFWSESVGLRLGVLALFHICM